MATIRRRARRWDESSHVAIGSGVAIAIIFAVVFAIGWFAPPPSPSTPVAAQASKR
jgi:hypothetical protein